MNQPTDANEGDVGVGGETSALNFREDTHRGRTNVRFSFTTEPFVLDFGEEKFGETHRGGDINQAGW